MTIYSLVLSFLMLFTSLFSPFANAPVPETEDDDFVPVLRFVSTSDTHVLALGDKPCYRITKMIKSAYEIAESDPDYKYLDAVTFSGDITDEGTFTGFSAFTSVTDKVLKDGTERLAVLAKAHDGYTYGAKSLEIFTSLTGQETDFHRVIKGYHFIGISRAPSDEEHYTRAQLEWLDKELKAATEAAPEQPVFVFNHEHIKETVFGSFSSDGWGVDYFTDILNKYPQVVDISGHSHYPANDPRAIWQGTFTAINDGGLAYYEFTVDKETSVHPEKSKTMTQALVIEVDADNRVLVRVLDVDKGKFVAEYLIDNITDSVKTKYDHNVRRENSSAPEFSENAALSVKKGITGLTVTVPQANTGDDNEVYLYRLVVTDKNGDTVHTAWKLSEYYFADVPDFVSFDSFKLSEGKYTVSVCAEDVWGNISAPLTAEIG